MTVPNITRGEVQEFLVLEKVISKKTTEERLQDAAKLTPRECKFLYLKLIDPTLSDNRASRLADFVGKQGTQVRTRIQGKLGGLLSERGLSRETIADKIFECINARKKRVIFLNQYNEDGKVCGVVAETKDVGPDYSAIDRSIKTLILIDGIAGKGDSRELPPPPQIPQDELEAAVGRGPKIVDAEYEVTDAQTG